jgi:hypothetical protein
MSELAQLIVERRQREPNRPLDVSVGDARAASGHDATAMPSSVTQWMAAT